MARRIDIQYIRLYTDGTAARKMESAVRVPAATLPKPRKQKKILIHVDPVAILGLMVAAVMLVTMLCGACRHYQLRNELTVMRSYVQELRNENEALHHTYENGYDLEQIQKTALALGMVPQDQVNTLQVTLAAPVEEETPSAWQEFYTFLTGLFA